MVYHFENTAVITMENGHRLLLSENGNAVAEQMVSSGRIIWHHPTIPDHIARRLFDDHREHAERMGRLGAEVKYLVFNYRSLFHALEHLYESGSNIKRYSGILYEHSVAQLSVGDEIQHSIDVAISGLSTGVCAFCEKPVYTSNVRGWSVGVPLSQEHMRLHKRYGERSVALNPICDKCSIDQVYQERPHGD